MKRIIYPMIALAGFSSAVMAANTQKLATQQDKISYALGVETGKAFKTHGLKINPSLYAQGLQDAISGKKLLMSDAEVKTTIMQFQKSAIAKMRAKLQQQAGFNLKQSNAFLATNKTKSGVVTLSNGLQYKILKKGTGPKPTANDVVTVNYEGKLVNGKVFDSSYKRGRPTTFPVKGVIQGWQQALQLMKTGATWMIYIPPKLGYGARGVPGVIGPNQALIFKVNLISIKKQGS